MASRARNTRLLLLSTTLIMGATAHTAFAQQQKTASAGDGSEGAELTTVIVTAEAKKAAANAPSKAPLTETQPQSVISSHFIEESTPETGNWSTVVLVAPSVSGITTNGGGVGEYNKNNIRGFADGQFNMTYDGVSFGDTNDPTHHTASYFPSSTIGAAVVDRGPGVAGDLGQANYGGALHFFSPAVSNTYSFTQKVTVGSFATHAYDTQIQTGTLDNFGGIKAWINLDERDSHGELSNAGGKAQTQSVKVVKDFNDRLSLTVFASHTYTFFNLPDGGPGATWQQVQTMGKNFSMNNNPATEWCACFNFEKKQSDFEYVLLKGKLSDSMNWENQAYTYFYSNKTLAASNIDDIINPDGSQASNLINPINYKNDVTVLGKTAVAALNYQPLDQSGYHKGNKYRVFGDIVRFNKDWSFGTLRLGGDYEISSTTRWNELYDLNNGQIDYKYLAVPANAAAQAPGAATAYPATNDKTFEGSDWAQFQVFGDFVWRPTSNLTITPGVKYYDFTRKIKALWDAIDGYSKPYNHGSFAGKSKYTKALKFLTGNYRITQDWSVYAQYGESFLTPSLSTLQTPLPSANSSKPSFAASQQLGTVFSRNAITADLDVYKVNISNLYVPAQVQSPDGDPAGSYYVNAGSVHYSGVEGQAAYSFNFGLNLFINGSLNTAKTVGGTELSKAPKWTDAFGGSYKHGPLEATVTFKEVGAQNSYTASSAVVTPDGLSLAAGQTRELKAYSVLNASVAYAINHNWRLKLAGYNLANHRSIIDVSGNGTATDLYSFQAGREVQATLEMKF